MRRDVDYVVFTRSDEIAQLMSRLLNIVGLQWNDYVVQECKAQR